MSQNRLAVVLALTIFAIVIVGWIVQLGGSYRAGSRNGSFGGVRFAVFAGSALMSAQMLKATGSQTKSVGPGGKRNHKQIFLIVGHLATPLSDEAFSSAALRSS